MKRALRPANGRRRRRGCTTLHMPYGAGLSRTGTRNTPCDGKYTLVEVEGEQQERPGGDEEEEEEADEPGRRMVYV